MEWCTGLDMYIIIDWHSIGNLTTGVYQDPMYDTTKEETYGFWRAMSRRYGNHNTVAFFELFNEPAAFGRVSWDQWKSMVEDQIALIRANSQQVIPLVAGFDWAYDLTPLRLNPIAAEKSAIPSIPTPINGRNPGSRNGRRTSGSPPPNTRSSPPNSADSRVRRNTGLPSSSTWRAKASVGPSGVSIRNGDPA